MVNTTERNVASVCVEQVVHEGEHRGIPQLSQRTVLARTRCSDVESELANINPQQAYRAGGSARSN